MMGGCSSKENVNPDKTESPVVQCPTPQDTRSVPTPVAKDEQPSLPIAINSTETVPTVSNAKNPDTIKSVKFAPSEAEIDTSEVEKFYKAKADTFRTKKMGFWETGDFDKGDITPGVKERDKEDYIISKLKEISPFDTYNEDGLRSVVETMFYITFRAGTDVIKEDELNNNFYVVEKGTFKSSDGKENFLHFGESALVFPVKSIVTITSVTDSSVFALSRINYQRNLMMHSKSVEQGNVDFLSSVPILAPLTPEQRVLVANSLKPMHYKPNEVIIKQGDIGSTFYIIEDGEVVVREHRTNPAQPSECLTVDLVHRKKGDYFGERALLKDEPRSADVVAVTETNCLTLSRDEFHELLGDLHDLLEHNEAMRLLQSIELFKPLSVERLYRLAGVLKPIEYKDSDIIVTQGKKGQNFYIIKEGHVKCVKTNDSGIEENVGELVAGEHFGEGALLTNSTRRVSVIAVGDVTVLALNKESFDTVLGSLKHHLEDIFNARSQKQVTHIDQNDLQTVRIIGAGSYGTVFLVRDKTTGMTYALKQMFKATIVSADHQAFVLNEKRILEKVHNPFLVNLVSTFRDEDSVYMVMELCLGGELYTLMRDTVNNKTMNENDEVPGCFPRDTVIFYTGIIVLALEYLHGLGVCHRDLKPENLLLTNEGYLKLADFGFAKQINKARTYSLCGTPEYTAPEVYRRCGHNVSVDWWALGVLLYEMASGFSPFHVNSQNPWDCYVEISRYTMAFPHVQFPSVFPHTLNNLLIQLMNPNPFRRIGSRRNGAEEIKQHPFFTDFDWEKLANQEIKAPYIPNVKGLLDTSNFSDEIKPLEKPENISIPPDTDLSWADEF